jgi:C1A family cysteine protease
MRIVLAVCFLLSSLAIASHKNPGYHTKHYAEKHALGLKRDKKRLNEFKKKSKRNKIEVAGPVPAQTDLRSLAAPIQNQGGCGSCWDFSLTNALWSTYRIESKDPGQFAYNYLLNNCGPGPSMWGCNGGDFDAAQNFDKPHGPWLESQDPYTQSEGKCKTGLAAAGYAISYAFVGQPNKKPTFQELASVLAMKKVMSIDVAVCGEWGNYGGGIFDSSECGASSINHMINLVGYDCETSKDASGNCAFDASGLPKNGDGFLIVQNQWGKNWGEEGYMRTRYGVDAVANTALYFMIEKPEPPTPPPVPPTPPPQPDPPTPPVPPAPSHGISIGWILVVLGVVGGILLISRKT